MRESEIEAHLRKRVTEAGGLCWKFTSPGLRGVPDRIVVIPGGETYFVELKRANGELRTSQERRAAELKERGANVWTLRSVEDVDSFMGSTL